jgi:hypothetical protein
MLPLLLIVVKDGFSITTYVSYEEGPLLVIEIFAKFAFRPKNYFEFKTNLELS